MRPLPGIFPLARALQLNSSLVKSNPEQPDFRLYSSLPKSEKRACLSTAMTKKMNGMFSADEHVWMFYSPSALYFLLPRVYFSSSFAPFPPRMEAKDSFP